MTGSSGYLVQFEMLAEGVFLEHELRGKTPPTKGGETFVGK